MTRKEFNQIPIGELKCEQATKQCLPSMTATRMLVTGDEIRLFCDLHAPNNSKEKAQPIDNRFAGLEPENLVDTVSQIAGPGAAKLRSKLAGHFGARLQSTGAAASGEISQIIMQTLDASPENPYIVIFDQFILEPFTGAGQFALVERDAKRRSFGGFSAGGTPVLTDLSGAMNWQPDDEGEPIRVGTGPGRVYQIVSVDAPGQVTLDRNITLPSVGLTLTMDGHANSEVMIADDSGIADGVVGADWCHFQKVITVDKIYRVDFVPGDTGDGIYSMSARALYGGSIDRSPNPEVQ